MRVHVYCIYLCGMYVASSAHKHTIAQCECVRVCVCNSEFLPIYGNSLHKLYHTSLINRIINVKYPIFSVKKFSKLHHMTRQVHCLKTHFRPGNIGHTTQDS